MGLNKKTRHCLERGIGLSMKQLMSMTFDEQRAYVERRTGAKTVFTHESNPTRRARGNVALGRDCFTTIEQVNERIDLLIAETKEAERE